MNRRELLMWADFRVTPAERIRGALDAARRAGRPATLVLVAEGEAAEVKGVEVRAAKPGEGVVAKGVCWVGEA